MTRHELPRRSVWGDDGEDDDRDPPADLREDVAAALAVLLSLPNEGVEPLRTCLLGPEPSPGVARGLGVLLAAIAVVALLADALASD